MSAQIRIMVVVGAVIAVVTATTTAILVTAFRPVGVTAQQAPQVFTLAASSTGNAVVVVGNGTGSAVPDQAQVNLGVTATRGNVRDAVSVASNDMSRLLAAVRGQGVVEKDIQTTYISIGQQTGCCPQNVTGYIASGQITVMVHHIQNVAPLIEAAVDAVGNDLQMNGVNLSIADANGAQKAARQAAITDANNRAQDWARLTGHRIGGLIGVSEILGAPAEIGCCKGGAGGGGAGFAIQPGQQSTTVTVAVTFELLA
jgi:uncharacterized protein YggE